MKRISVTIRGHDGGRSLGRKVAGTTSPAKGALSFHLRAFPCLPIVGASRNADLLRSGLVRMPAPYQTRRLWQCLWGLFGSATLHLLLLAVIVTLIACDLLLLPDATSSQRPLVVTVRHERPLEVALRLESLPEISLEPAAPAELVEAADLQAALSDPRWQALVDPADELPNRDAAEDFVQRELMRIIADAERRSAEENLAKLTALSERLTNISSEKNVGNINTQLNKLLGSEQRADRPATEKIAGEFEFATAQMHDVKRAKDTAGKWTYTVVLLDAAGRTFESPMDPSEGESMYRTMQLIKSNPLLERVYRGVVMSVMDKVLKSSQP